MLTKQKKSGNVAMLTKAIKIIVGSIAGAVILLAVAALAIYNFRCNDEFFTMSLHNLFMLIISIGVAYFLVQRKIDERRYQDGQIKVIEKIISDIQKSLSDDILSNDWNDNLIKLREINNKISVLKRVCSGYNEELMQNVDYIQDNFNELRELYEDIDSKYTRQNEEIPPDQGQSIKNLSNKIISKSDNLWVDLYTKK